MTLRLPAIRIAGVGKWPLSPGRRANRTEVILDHRGEICSQSGPSPYFRVFGRTGEAGLNEDRDVGAPLVCVGARCRTLLIGPGRATTQGSPLRQRFDLILMAARWTDRLHVRGSMAARTNGGNPGQRFRGKVALVTGGSRGIGRAVSLRLAREGARIGVNFVSNEPAAAETVEQVNRLGTEAEAVQADVSDRSAVQAMVDRILERFSRIDLLVNNAGIVLDGDLTSYASDADLERDLDAMWGVNVRGIINCTRAVLPQMRKRRSGSIVNVSSIAGFGNISPLRTFYSATKAAVMKPDQTLRPGTRPRQHQRQFRGARSGSNRSPGAAHPAPGIGAGHSRVRRTQCPGTDR